jgi:hypothetical protein
MVRIMVSSATFNNILAMSWREETGVSEENHRPAASQ